MKKLFLSVALAASFAGASGFLYAAVSVPPGSTVTCTITVSAQSVAVSNGPNAGAVSGSGSATFLSVATQQEPVASSTLTPQTLNFSGFDPAYGQFNFAFDQLRPVTPSTVTANQPGADFPATGDIHANVTGTVSGLPGIYTNNNELHLISRSLQTFNPQVNETYTVAEDCIFSNANDPNAPTFTISAGSVVVLN